MPVFDNPLAQYAITVWRGEEIYDVVVARDGYRAASFAKGLIDEIAPLQGGDKITVTQLEGTRREPFHDLPADDFPPGG